MSTQAAAIFRKETRKVADIDRGNDFPEINCRLHPSVPSGSGLVVYNHDNSDGIIKWDPGKIKIIQMSPHRNGDGLNDRVWQWLHDHRNQIPDVCRGKRLFFPKTTFLDGNKEVFRCLNVGRKGGRSVSLIPVDHLKKGHGKRNVMYDENDVILVLE